MPIFFLKMGSTSNVRLKLSTELETIRSKIANGTLVLFVGEQVSTLVSPDNPCPSLDDWWQIVNHSEVSNDIHAVKPALNVLVSALKYGVYTGRYRFLYRVQFNKTFTR